MARRRLAANSSSDEVDDERVRNSCDCKFIPHGFYSLIPAVLSTMAFWTAIVQDGCDFTKLQGGNIEKVTGSDIYPFVELGVAQYRTPIYYPNESQWKKVFTNECLDYPEGSMDIYRNLVKYFSLISSIFTGFLAFFLWFTTCLTLSSRTWKFCAVVAMLAAVCRGGSLLFFFSNMCTGNQSSCALSFGSTMEIIGIVQLVVSSLAMFGYYPEPKLRQLTEEELVQPVNAEFEELKPKRLLVGSHPQRRIAPTVEPTRYLAGGESTRNLGGSEPSRYLAGGESSRYLGGGGGESSRYLGGGGASSRYLGVGGGGESSRYLYADEASHYDTVGDGRSVASQSFYKPSFDEQTVSSRSYANPNHQYADDMTYGDGGRSVATQSYFYDDGNSTGFV